MENYTQTFRLPKFPIFAFISASFEFSRTLCQKSRIGTGPKSLLAQAIFIGNIKKENPTARSKTYQRSSIAYTSWLFEKSKKKTNFLIAMTPSAVIYDLYQNYAIVVQHNYLVSISANLVEIWGNGGKIFSYLIRSD